MEDKTVFQKWVKIAGEWAHVFVIETRIYINGVLLQEASMNWEMFESK